MAEFVLLFTMCQDVEDGVVHKDLLQRSDLALDAVTDLMAASRMEGVCRLRHRPMDRQWLIDVEASPSISEALALFEPEAGAQVGIDEVRERLMAKATEAILGLMACQQSVALGDVVKAATQIRELAKRSKTPLIRLIRRQANARLALLLPDGEFTLSLQDGALRCLTEASDLNCQVMYVGKDHLIVKPEKDENAKLNLPRWQKPRVRVPDQLRSDEFMIAVYRNFLVPMQPLTLRVRGVWRPRTGRRDEFVLEERPLFDSED